MRLELKERCFELVVSRNKCRAKVPLRLKLTFYICVVAILCMASLAAICIVKALRYTQLLMKERLTQLAILTSQKLERQIRSQALALNGAVQGDRVTGVLQKLFNETSTAYEWGNEMSDAVEFLFQTSLRSFQALYIYDNTATLIFSMANPDLPAYKVQQIQAAAPALLPLHNATKKLSPTSSSSSHNLTDSTLEGGSYSNITYNTYHGPETPASPENLPKLEFVNDPYLGFASLLTSPVELYNNVTNSNTYSFSYTMPISTLMNLNNTQLSYFVAYSTAVADCSDYVHLGEHAVYNNSHVLQDITDPRFTIVDADQSRGWKYVFPTTQDPRSRPKRNTAWHTFDSFPALEADISLANRYANLTDNRKRGGAMMKTQTPHLVSASVGYSYANLINQRWLVALSLPASTVESGYRHQTKTLVGVALVVLIFVLFAAYFVTGITTRPANHISRGMILVPRRPQAPQPHDLPTPDSNASELNDGDHRSETESEGTLVAIPPKTHSCSFDDAEKAVASPGVINRTVTHIDDSTNSFQIPQPLEPLNRRWINDEFDELIVVYNEMIHKLNAQYKKMEDEVQLRTREARHTQSVAETANAAKSFFMMNISHELLTPMNGIMGITAVTIEENSLDEIRSGLHTIIRSGYILQELLHELLTYAAHLAGAEESTVHFELEQLAQSFVSTFALRAKTHGVKFTVEALADGSLNGDLDRVKHVCTRLISNALKFSDPARNCSHCVSVQITVVEAELPNSDEMLQVIVADNGVGIAKNKMGHIFELFVQGDDALQKRYVGTGLGLAMSKLLCERLGAIITVYTRAHVGTTVVFKVPVRNVTMWNARSGFDLYATPVYSQPTTQGDQLLYKTTTEQPGKVFHEPLSGTPTQSPERPNLVRASTQLTQLTKILPFTSPRKTVICDDTARQFRVLVADDNQVMRDLLRRTLTVLGIKHIDAATNGRSAVEKVELAIVRGVRYSIIFMDLSMPELDGIDATIKIRKQLGYFCPVVMLTGYSDQATIDQCARAGVQKLLVKPVSRDRIFATLQELI